MVSPTFPHSYEVENSLHDEVERTKKNIKIHELLET